MSTKETGVIWACSYYPSTTYMDANERIQKNGWTGNITPTINVNTTKFTVRQANTWCYYSIHGHHTYL